MKLKRSQEISTAPSSKLFWKMATSQLPWRGRVQGFLQLRPVFGGSERSIPSRKPLVQLEDLAHATKFQLLRQWVDSNRIMLRYVEGGPMPADGLTKRTARQRFSGLRPTFWSVLNIDVRVEFNYFVSLG